MRYLAEGPLAWIDMALLRCLAWTTMQGKWISYATLHLFRLRQTTSLIVYPNHLKMPLIYFARETRLNPTFSKLLNVPFLSCFCSSGCAQWWISEVSHFTELKSQSKTQQSSLIICLNQVLKHQSVMVPWRQIRAFSKFDRNFMSVRSEKTQQNPNRRSLPNLDSIPGLSYSSCHGVLWNGCFFLWLREAEGCASPNIKTPRT